MTREGWAVTVLDRPAYAPAEIRLLRVLAVIVAAVLFGVGWTAGKLVSVAAWSVTAVRVGWDDARGGAG